MVARVSEPDARTRAEESRPGLCAADFNGGELLDDFEHDDFMACFECEFCPISQLEPACNRDGFGDFVDLDEFIADFEEGGP